MAQRRMSFYLSNLGVLCVSARRLLSDSVAHNPNKIFKYLCQSVVTAAEKSRVHLFG